VICLARPRTEWLYKHHVESTDDFRKTRAGIRPYVSKGERATVDKLHNLRKSKGPSPRLLAIRNPNAFKAQVARDFTEKLFSLLPGKVSAVYLVGSVVHGKATHTKDVDLIVVGSRFGNAEGNKVGALERKFQLLLGVNVDTYSVQSAKEIVSDAVLLKRGVNTTSIEFPEKIRFVDSGKDVSWSFQKLRVAGKEGFRARVMFEQQWKKEVLDYARTMKKIIDALPRPWKRGRGELEPRTAFLVALCFSYMGVGGANWAERNRIARTHLPQSGYEDFQFTLSRNTKLREILGLERVPQRGEIFKAVHKLQPKPGPEPDPYSEYKKSVKYELDKVGKGDLGRFVEDKDDILAMVKKLHLPES